MQVAGACPPLIGADCAPPLLGGATDRNQCKHLLLEHLFLFPILYIKKQTSRRCFPVSRDFTPPELYSS